ncbi:WD40 containing SNARE-dependent exocytosis protein [Mycena kentingensis (nom. inval.)]|nr:WD40 containing SNARE-dependent exocytosis protein [Mycena kentingensis (nom. inval.)]
MFKSPTSAYPDFSSDLRDKPDWKIAALRSFEYAVQVSAVAVEPITGLLEIGTSLVALAICRSIPSRNRVRRASSLRRTVSGGQTRAPGACARAIRAVSCSTSQIVTLGGNANSVLNVWDLSVFGRPKHVALARFDGATSLAVSPSHSHALIGLESGEIRTYDLLCLRKSDYRMPNMWKLDEEQTMATCMDGNAVGSGAVVDVVSHPRDLNLLFVAYSEGVILSNLRNTLRAYEFELPAGAPEVYGYGHSEIMVHRRPSVTAIALHPAGHFFAVGYSDGIVAFWAIEDEDQPLLARTLDDLDVNKVNYETLELKHEPTPGARTDLQAHFVVVRQLGRSSWRGVGLDDFGWTVDRARPPTPAPNNTPLHPFMRAAMQTSLVPKSDHFYDTAARVAQDFFLVPKNNPHFETYEFPPPVFTAAAELPAAQEEAAASGSVADDLAEMLKLMTVNDDPRALSLPTQFGHVVLKLRGGAAWNDESKAKEIKLANVRMQTSVY